MGEPGERTPLVHANRTAMPMDNWGDGCYQDGDKRTDRLFDVTCPTCLDSCEANGPWWMASVVAARRAELELRAVEARYTALVEAVDGLMDAHDHRKYASSEDALVALEVAINDLRAAREALKGDG